MNEIIQITDFNQHIKNSKFNNECFLCMGIVLFIYDFFNFCKKIIFFLKIGVYYQR